MGFQRRDFRQFLFFMCFRVLTSTNNADVVPALSGNDKQSIANNMAYECSSSYSCYYQCATNSFNDSASNASQSVLKNDIETFCFCDTRCEILGDCCYDYDTYCLNNSKDMEEQHLPLDTITHHHSEDIPYTEVDEKIECISVDQYPSSAFWAKTGCQDDWGDNYVKELCLDPDPSDMLTQLPVTDTNKYVYRNAFCAECNTVFDYKFMLLDSVCRLSIPTNIINKRQLFSAFLQRNCVTYIRSGFAEPPRACLKTVSTCPKSHYHSNTMQTIARDCGAPIQFPVFNGIIRKDPVIFKNPECAICNGLPPNKQKCLKLYHQHLNMRIIGLREYVTVEHVDMYGTLFMDKDDSDRSDDLHHVITNYNAEMTRTMVVNEDDRYIIPIIHVCPYGAVFDPFWGQCRQIHCETGYVLEGNECVLDINVMEMLSNAADLVSRVVEGRNDTYDHRFKLIVTVNVTMDGRPVLEFLKNISIFERIVGFLNITECDAGFSSENSSFSFKQFLPQAWMNHTEVDVSYNASGDGEVVIMLTYTPSFPSFDLTSGKFSLNEVLDNLDSRHQLVVAAEYEVYVDDKEVDTKGLNLKAVIDVVSTKLRKLWYVMNSCERLFSFYHSSELTILNGSDPFCPTISITGKSDCYGCNETLYFAYDPEYGYDEQDFYVVVCDEGFLLPPDCPRIMYNSTEFSLFHNGTAVVDNGQTYEQDQYEIDNGYLVVCSNFSNQIDQIYVFFFGFSGAQIYMSFVLGGISDVCLILTIVTYAIFGELRTLPGRNLLGLMVANLCCNCSLLLSVSNNIASNICVAGAILIHYFTLANLCWMTCIAFDAYFTFGGNRKQIFTRFRSAYSKRGRYIMYSAFAWGVPGLLVQVGILFNYCDCGPFPMWYGLYLSCWINDPYGFIYLFTIPASIILLSNYVLFILAINGIKSSKFKNSNQFNSANAKRDIVVYIKLLTTTGFGWVFAYIAALAEVSFLWSFFLVLVSLQGVFIFLAFFCNKRILMLYEGFIKCTPNDKFSRGSNSTVLSVSECSTNKRPLSLSEDVKFETYGEDNLGCDVPPILEIDNNHRKMLSEVRVDDLIKGNGDVNVVKVAERGLGLDEEIVGTTVNETRLDEVFL